VAEIPDLKTAFGLPPEKAIAFFRSKGIEVSFDWHDMWKDARAKAFTVAKATRLDVLKDIRDAVDKALATGQTSAQFKKELTPLLQAKGWWGKQIVVDPRTGTKIKAQLGSPRRLATIYNANMQSSYMAGRYQEQMENAEAQPWWMYVAVMDSRTRPAHAAMNGQVFRCDDPFWATCYPPNGWNCRCRVRAMDGERIAAKGVTPQSSKGRMSTDEVVVSRRTGEIRERTYYTDPKRDIRFSPDPGWDYNPGRAWPRWDAGGALPDCLELDFAEFGEKDCIRAKPDQKTWKDFGRADLRDVPAKDRLAAPALLERAQTRDEARLMMTKALGLDKQPLITVATPIDQVALRVELLDHMVEKFQDARERYANFIVPTLAKPYEIWLTEYEDGWRERFIGLFEGKDNLAAIVRVNQDGSLLWNIMQADARRLNKQRIGEMLFGK
jgi:SPP1 gp7 family putative phage head morphogenesis protein